MFFHRQKHTPKRSASENDAASNPSLASAALHRSVIALAMKELEHPVVVREHSRYPAEEQPIFLMTYSAFVIWGLSAGLRDLLPAKEVRDGIRALREHLAALPWFDPDIFDPILSQMLVVMPLELTQGRYSGLVSPAADMLMAAKIAGYALDAEYEPDFGYHITYMLGRFAKRARSLVSEARRGQSAAQDEKSP